MIDLNGKVVVVTGASGTLGRAAARVFANANASLVLTGRNKEQLEETARQLDADKVIISCDLSDIKQIDALLNEAIKHYGRLDVLLNIAGGFSMGPKPCR